MPSPTFEFRIPTHSRAYSWIMEKKEAGVNVSQSIRELIETHADMFDRMESKDRHIEALKLKVRVLENQDSPDFRSMLDENLEQLRNIRKVEKDQSSNDS